MELDLQFIPPGDDIYTQDGERIGQVKEIRDGYVHVDATAAPDYWLPAALVTSFSDGRIIVAFDKKQLGKHKLKQPGRR
jgi:hypothetical protein